MSNHAFTEEKNRIETALTDAGVRPGDAALVADCLATADLYGVSSHGESVLPPHLERLRRGGYNLAPQFRVLRETAAFALIDGDNAIGPVCAAHCMEYAMEKVTSAGMFTVFSRNNNTFGPAFYYPLKAAERGYIAFLCSNSPAQMAPSGGSARLLGTNPFSVVIPVPGEDPIMVDMATSVVAKSKFKEYKAAGKSLPPGWALDENGNPTTDPDEAMRGLVLPMAGFKGYALSLLIDFLAGALSGAACLSHVGRFYSENNASMNVGYFMTVMDPVAVFGDEYGKMAAAYVAEIRNSPNLPGCRIALPGDDRLLARNRNAGE